MQDTQDFISLSTSRKAQDFEHVLLQ